MSEPSQELSQEPSQEPSQKLSQEPSQKVNYNMIVSHGDNPPCIVHEIHIFFDGRTTNTFEFLPVPEDLILKITGNMEAIKLYLERAHDITID